MGTLFLVVRSWGPQAIQEWVERAGVWAPVVLILAKISTLVLAPLSGLILYSLAGALFGFWKAFGLLVLVMRQAGSSHSLSAASLAAA